MLLGHRVAVLSPHLDDAIFSIGAGIAKASRSGATVSVITVFAGDPESRAAPGWWDEKAGFGSEGEAARARRVEDREACRLVGAVPVWLPFADATYERHVADSELWESVAEAVRDADSILVPGYPLAHVDHLRLARVVLGRRVASARVGLYVEQPYAKRRSRRRPWVRPELSEQLGLRAEPTWVRLQADARDRSAKRRAALSYRSQIPLFGRGQREALGRLLILRVALYEGLRGGERVAWLHTR